MIEAFIARLQAVYKNDEVLNAYIEARVVGWGAHDSALPLPQLTIASDFTEQTTAMKKKGKLNEAAIVWVDLWYQPSKISVKEHVKADAMSKRLCELLDKTNTAADVNIRVQQRSALPNPDSSLWKRRMVFRLTQQ